MLTLMTLSWYSNFRRFATLILFQHDAANIPLYVSQFSLPANKLHNQNAHSGTVPQMQLQT